MTKLEEQLAAIGAGGVEPLRKPQCLHQIQEPPTKTEALAHYSQQAILAMGEAGAAQHVEADVPASGTVALTQYLKDCEQHSITPDVGGAFAAAFKAGFKLAAPSAVPAAVAVPAIDALREAEAALEVAIARILKASPGHSISVTSEAKALVTVRAALAATPAAAAPLPLLVRDIARELGITCAEACLALKPLGNFSTNTAVTAEMLAKLRECFPEAAAAPVVLPEPDLWVYSFIHSSATGRPDEKYGPVVTKDRAQAFGVGCIEQVGLTEQQVRALLATATAPTEPFGYFKAEPFGWTDCGPDDEGAVALYEKPQAMLAIGGQAQAVPHQQLTSEIELVLSDQDSKLSPGAQRALKWCLTWVSVPLQLAAPKAQADARDAAFEAVRKAFCKLQRYSFFLDDKGNVRRTEDYCGNWVEFEAVHTLFEPAAVDAAIAAAKGE